MPSCRSGASCGDAGELVRLSGKKGAARKSVRPKSREETPKEGSETSDEVASLATPI